MKKFLSFLTVCAIATPFISAVNACGKTFYKNDLSTWGSDQKKLLASLI